MASLSSAPNVQAHWRRFRFRMAINRSVSAIFPFPGHRPTSPPYQHRGRSDKYLCHSRLLASSRAEFGGAIFQFQGSAGALEAWRLEVTGPKNKERNATVSPSG